MTGRARIRVIDDDPGPRDTLRDMLQLKGYAIDAASRSAEGLERVRTLAYDAAIVGVKAT